MSKKKKILIPIISIFLIIGIFVTTYLIDNIRFFSSLKKYNEDYMMKITYLVINKDEVPENINLDNTFYGYTKQILFSNSELVMLERKGDYLYLDLNGQVNKSILDSEVDHVFALNDTNGNVLEDCEYDKKTNIAKIPVKYYENADMRIPIQFEIESALTKKQVENVEVKTKVKSIYTKEKTIKQNNNSFYVEFTIDNFTMNVNKNNIDIYVNGFDTKLKDDYFEYDNNTKTVTIGIPALLVNEIDVKVNNSLISSSLAADVNGINVAPSAASAHSAVSFANMNTINLKSKPGYAEGDSYQVTIPGSEFDYCGVNGVNCYSFTSNMGPGNFQVSNNVFDYDYTYFTSSGSYYAAYTYDSANNRANFNNGVYAYPYRINLTKLNSTYISFTNARKVPSTLAKQRILAGTGVFDESDLSIPFFCLHQGEGSNRSNLTITVTVIEKTSDYMILSMISNNKYYGQSANAYIKVTWNKYVRINKSYQGTDDGKTRRFSIYKSTDGTCNNLTGWGLYYTQTKWSDGKYYLGWEGTEAEWNNYGYGYPNLTAGTYCIWESSDDGTGTFKAPSNYGQVYTYNGNNVTTTGTTNGVQYTFGKIKITGSETSDMLTVGVKNTSKGYIELQKSYTGTDDGQTRYFGLYKSHNNECRNVTSSDLITSTSTVYSGGKYYLGWDETERKGTLDFGQTYCIWESGNAALTRAPTKYVASYKIGNTDITQVDNGWIYGKITLSGDYSYNDPQTSITTYYDKVNVTNTSDGTKLRVKKQISGQANSSSNAFYNTYHFKFFVYPDGCTQTDGSCPTLATLMTGNDGITDYWDVDQNGKGLLEVGSKYVIVEDLNQYTGEANVYDASGNLMTNNYPYLTPVNAFKQVTVPEDEITVPYANSDNYDQEIKVELNKKVNDINNFDFSTYHFKFKVYLNATSCTDSNYGTGATASADFYTDDNGVISITDIGSVELSDANLNDKLCIVEYVEDTTTMRSSIYDSSQRIMSSSSIPFFSKPAQRPVEVRISDLPITGTYSTGGWNTGNIYSLDINNTVPKGYFEVQKVVDGIPDYDFSTYHFAFKVYNSNHQIVSYIYTDDTGKATYGKDSNGNGTLEYGSTYYLQEITDSTSGYALRYASDHSHIIAKSYLNPDYSVSTSSNELEVTIDNVGTGIEGRNISDDMVNIPDYGYITLVKQTYDADDLDYRIHHFGLEIYDSNDNYIDTVYTDANREAVYGLDPVTGKPTLEMGTTYHIREIMDSEQNAVIFDDNHNPITTNIKVRPRYSGFTGSILATITKTGNNTYSVANQVQYGYISIKKDITTDDPDFLSNYFFAFDVYDENENYLETVYTDTTGAASYGMDSLRQPYLEKGQKFRIRESVNSRGFANLYDSNHDIVTPSNPDYSKIKPVYPQGKDYKEVEVVNVTVGNYSGVTIATLTNEFNTAQQGYVGVQKTINGGTLDLTTNHFKYTVTDSNSTNLGTVCTSNSGLATYGQDTNGDGTLDLGDVYTFEEEVDSNGYAVAYTTDACTTTVSTNPNVKPTNLTKSVTVANVGLSIAGANIENYPNNKTFGYAEIQKTSVPTGTTIDYTNNFFKYEVTGPGITTSETICTDSTGKATYGKDTNNNGTLEKNNTYTFTEEVDSNGYAVVYTDNTCGTVSTSSTKAVVKPINNSINVTINNIGTGTNGVNTSNYPNKYYGYVEVRKTVDSGTINYTDYHFKYTVTGSGITTPVTVCTDNLGRANYGQDATGNGILEKNSSYTFTEEVDSNGYAVVYSNNTCTTVSTNVNKPLVSPTNSSVSVTVSNVGSMTSGLNEVNYPNHKYFGYAEIQKKIKPANLTIDYTANHFKYSVTGPGITTSETICTDNSGIATYGKNSNNDGTLEKNNTYTFVEEVDSNGYAVVYTNNTCSTVSTSSTKPMVKPINNGVSVTINNIGSGTNGANSNTYTNKYYGYVGVVKSVDDLLFDYSANHFKYTVTGSGILNPVTICTDNAGLATYGKDSTGNGTLEQNSFYVITEEVDSDGYAIAYTSDTCSTVVSTNPNVKPANSSITINVNNVGNFTDGNNESSYPNTKYSGYAEVQKTVDSTATIDYTTNHFKYTVTGTDITTTQTVCTDNNGKATYGKDNSGTGTLEKNNSYTFTEEVDVDGFAVVYTDNSCGTVSTSANKAMVKPISNSVNVTINNIGSGVNGANTENYPNKYFGYIEIQKTTGDSTINYSQYHFKYSISDGTNVTSICTDNSGLATFGKDSNDNGTLEKNSVYAASEEVDQNGYAVVYSDSACSTISTDTNKPIVSPANSPVNITVTNVGTKANGLNYTEQLNNKYYGYAEVQKQVEPTGTVIDYTTNHFKYTVTGTGISQTVCTDNTGIATYGKDTNNNGTLEKNTVLTFVEEVDQNGYAIVYTDNTCLSASTTSNKSMVKPVNNSVNVTINNIGAGTNGANTENYTNKYYGYAEVQKQVEPAGSTLDYTTNHFKYNVTGPGISQTVCTDNTGKATYGKDITGNGTLEKNTTITFVEEIDTNGYAVVYDSNTCSNISINNPMVRPTINSTSVTISNVGSLSNGSNTSTYTNKYFGYAEVQKEIEPAGSTIDYTANHFKYIVTDSSNTNYGFICTNDQGIATFGKDVIGNGNLEKGSSYKFTEVVDTNGYAVVYTDSTCGTTSTSANKAMVRPNINIITITINNIGSLSNGANSSTYPNKYYGYVGVQKQVDGTAVDYSTYHFRYQVKDSNNTNLGYVCTDNSGKAIYGQDSTGNGTLEKNTTITFIEDVDTDGYAVVYDSDTCSGVSTSTSKPNVKPANQSVNVTVTNVGSMSDGEKLSTYSNDYDKCLSIKKTDSLDESVLQGAEFELFTDSACQTTTGKTATTDTNGIATFNNLTNSTYYAKEITTAPGYSITGTSNCKQVTSGEATSSTSSCRMNTITNDALYIGFYKQKEDGTPLTSATFKVKNQDTNKYVQVSGTYNNCYAYSGETSDAAEASVISVNDISTGLYCIGKIPSGTYTAEEQATGDEGYWFNNGTITGITTSKEIQAVQGDGSNAIKNNPYVVTFYKVREDETNMENATFVIKEKNTTNYITTSGTSNVTEYNGCYIYSGTTTDVTQASQLSSDANGRVCVIRIPNNKHYSVEEKSTGNSAYSINENINIELTPSTSVDSVSNSNKITNYPYYINFFKVDGEENAMEGTKFIVRNTSNEYLVADAPDSQRAKYKDCYIYTGTTSTTGSATEFVSNASGEICIVKTPSDTYTAIETESGNPSYYVDPNNNTIENITTKVIDENETRTSITDQNALKLVNNPYVLNFYKTSEDGTSAIDGAVFKVKNNEGKYIVSNGKSTLNGYTDCYEYSGLTNDEETGTEITTTGGLTCIVKIPSGTYTVEEKTPAIYHTFGNELSKDIAATTSLAARTDLNKFINYPTEYTFTKEVDNNSIPELTTDMLKTIPFKVIDTNTNEEIGFVLVNGVYQYENAEGISGDRTTNLYLDNNRRIKVEHLPVGTYKIIEYGVEGSCQGEGCVGFYTPKEGTIFAITNCSNSNADSSSCTGTTIITNTIRNDVTKVEFTKSDFYSYVDSHETVKFENDEERSAFDEITFKVFYLDNNNNRVYVDFAKVGDIGTCKTDNSYSEYRYIPEGTNSSLISGYELTKEIHTCGGHINITHLCRGKTYYIEEVSVSGNSVFTLPEREEDRIKEVTVGCTTDSESQSSSQTVVINDKPTKVKFEKRDSKYGYLINDERTTFEVYRCAEGTTCHPGDYDTVEERAAAGMTLVKFNTRGFITGDEEDSGIEVYRAVTNVDNASNTVTSLHPYQGKLVLRYLESGYNYVLLETESPEGYKLPNGRNAETTFTISTTTVQVDEIDVPNKPTSLIIKKYDEEGNLLEGAKFKIYEGTTCDESLSAKDQPRTLLTLKTIRDGVYENREVKDTDTLITCTDRENNRCSDVVTTLTYDNYVDTWANYNNSVNQENNRVSMEAGEILVQYLEYGKCYIIEEVEAPKGYSLPEKEEDRFVMVTITKESDVVDTGRSLVNKPTPFTFYKFDDYNNLIDGGEFKLQKLNSNKKYEDVTVTREEESGKVYYKVDPNSENKVITTTNGEATVYNLEKGQYRIVETKAPEGMELPIKEINVSIFYVDDNGKVTGNSIITNKPKTEKIVVTPKSSAELIVTISTGMKIINYGLIILGVLGVIGLLLIASKKRKDSE